jgi:hypothetical protein
MNGTRRRAGSCSVQSCAHAGIRVKQIRVPVRTPLSPQSSARSAFQDTMIVSLGEAWIGKLFLLCCCITWALTEAFRQRRGHPPSFHTHMQVTLSCSSSFFFVTLSFHAKQTLSFGPCTAHQGLNDPALSIIYTASPFSPPPVSITPA